MSSVNAAERFVAAVIAIAVTMTTVLGMAKLADGTSPA